MVNSGPGAAIARPKGPAASSAGPAVSIDHYLRLILRRKWLVVAVTIVIFAATVVVSYRLPNVYTSETVILVDPQQVPEAYVKPTVTGDIRNRLGTLSQQILSSTRLQKIIDALNLYPVERKTMVREDVIAHMRKDITVGVMSQFGNAQRQDLQAFRITYSGGDPNLVAQVTNELASLFIEENLKAREQQATGTTEFLENQLKETRKALEEQESKLKDFKLKHVGEMPEQQTATLQILGQYQSQLQLESDALSRAEQQKSYIQSMMAQSGPVIDVDPQDTGAAAPSSAMKDKKQGVSALALAKSRLAQLRKRYTDAHPDVQRLKRKIADEEAREAREEAAAAANAPVPAPPPETAQVAPAAVEASKSGGMAAGFSNPVLQTQIQGLDAEIAKHRAEQQRLSKLISTYQVKLEAIPINEQQIADLVRDYEISKTHYSQLLEKQLSAETATQLELRQKGEKFSVLDPAQPAEKPSKPNRVVLNAAGGLGGLVLGLLLALSTELLGTSISSSDQVAAATGLPVLEVIPVIRIQGAGSTRRRRAVVAAVSCAVLVIVAGAAVLLWLHPHLQGF